MNAVSNVQVTDDKYYWKGLRESGRDKRDIIPKETSKVKVTGDADYVVAYGVTTQRVTYTVNYQDADGNALAPENTFYGDIGDRPVVAYQYIENYIPQAYAVTKTLAADETQNIVTFTYTPGATDTIVTNTIVNTPGATTATNTAAATPEDAATADANANAQDALADGTGGNNTVTNPDEGTPQAVQNLDENTPTSNIDASGSTSPMVIAVIAAVLAFAALAGLLVFLYKKRKSGVE